MEKRTRSRVGIGAAALAGLCAMALSAAAQDRPVTSTKDNDATVKINVSGNVDLDYVWRAKQITEYTNGFTDGAGARHENTFEGYAAVRLNAELSDKVSAMVELGTKRVDAGLINEFGFRSSFAGQTVALREAQVNLADFLVQDLRAQIGITTWSFDVRGKGSSMAFDLRHSQPLGGAPTVLTPGGRIQGISGGLTTREATTGAGAANVLRNYAGDPEELSPVGMVVTYGREAFKVDVVLLPAIVEGGFTNADEALYAIDFTYNLDTAGMKGSKMGAIFALHQFPDLAGSSGNERMFTIGGGMDLWLMDKNVELYGEAYGQFGKVADNVPGVGDVKAAGYAFQLGAEYHVPQNKNNLWAGANYTFYSGDKDGAANTKMDRFVGYENVHDLMILEDMYYGFDWDSNYWALKGQLGGQLAVAGQKNNLDLMLTYGYARATGGVNFTIPGAPRVYKLGSEVDAKAKWWLNKQAALTAGIGYLWGSKMLEDSMTADAAPHPRDHTVMYSLGVDLKF